MTGIACFNGYVALVKCALYLKTAKGSPFTLHCVSPIINQSEGDNVLGSVCVSIRWNRFRSQFFGGIGTGIAECGKEQRRVIGPRCLSMC